MLRIIKKKIPDYFSEAKKKVLLPKESKAYQKIIDPVAQNPNNYFDYLSTGEIFPKEDLDLKSQKKAEFTIHIFKLNHKGLCDERKKIALQLAEMKNGKMTIESILEFVPDYRTFIQHIYSRL